MTTLDDDLRRLLDGVSLDDPGVLAQFVGKVVRRVIQSGESRSNNGIWVDLLAESRSIEELTVALGSFQGQMAAEEVAARETALRRGAGAIRARLVGALVELDARETAASIAAPKTGIGAQ